MLTPYALNLAIDVLIRNRELEVALHTANPGDDGTANEVLATIGGNPSAYERVIIPAGGWTVDAALVNATVTAAHIFPTPTEDWGSIPYMTFWDGSNFFAIRQLASPRIVSSGVQVALLPGVLELVIRNKP